MKVQNDLLSRLQTDGGTLATEAADEIERLRESRRRLLADIKELVTDPVAKQRRWDVIRWDLNSGWVSQAHNPASPPDDQA